eukprot:CAMPEP_0179490028 /NCGR_PEP_ID=MMETSP0799-20121207/65210_1 /TAXON_ID=46947 /ORGANISM="Geminigera cryophila, Strain CCMP2564" /LENGTH=504 /DNA_ID=CAMNT_0021306133 /DNA_START=15 /DNA_END=1529 /DNA_ORIENTATION=-
MARSMLAAALSAAGIVLAGGVVFLRKNRTKSWGSGGQNMIEGQKQEPVFVEPNFQITKLITKSGWLRSEVIYTILGFEVWRAWESYFCTLKWVLDSDENPQGMYAVLCADREDTPGVQLLFPLRRCLVAANEEMDRSLAVDPAYCLQIKPLIIMSSDLNTSSPNLTENGGSHDASPVAFKGGGAAVRLFVADKVSRDEWIQSIRQHAVCSYFQNGYTCDFEAGQLGEGTYGKVYMCRDRGTDKEWACKVIDKTSLNPVETQNKFYLVMVAASGGDLFDFILDQPEQHFTERVASCLFFQMLSAIGYMHTLKIVHRDIKPENFLVSTPPTGGGGGLGIELMLCDFGFACEAATATTLTVLCGTPGYMAPEIVDEHNSVGYGVAADMWSLGVVLYVLLTGRPPFAGESDKESLQLSLLGQYDETYLEGRCSTAAIDLVKRCLTRDPIARITAQEALQHEWLSMTQTLILKDVVANIRQWHARQRLRKAVHVTRASVRLINMLKPKV